MGDNLESKEWDGLKLNCIFLRVQMPWDQGFGRGQCEKHPPCQGSKPRKFSHGGPGISNREDLPLVFWVFF